MQENTCSNIFTNSICMLTKIYIQRTTHRNNEMDIMCVHIQITTKKKTKEKISNMTLLDKLKEMALEVRGV